MGIVDLFRPRHRHSNADVRADAVRQLGQDELDLIVKLAREDSDASVRRIALGKIDDPAILVDLGRAESERALRDLAESRAAGIWITQATTATTLAQGQEALAGLTTLGDQRAIAEVAGRAELVEVRDAALEVLDDNKALAELARNPSTHMAARTTALARIDDEEVLRSIAVDEKRKDIALAALERIEDDALIEAVAAKAKHKGVRSRARKKLAERQTPESTSPEQKRRHAERVQLVRIAESLARKNEWVASVERMAELRRDWEAVGAGDDGDLATRFERACERYDARHKAWAKAQAERKAARSSEAASKADTPAGDSGKSKDAGDAEVAKQADAAAQADADTQAGADAQAGDDSPGETAQAGTSEQDAQRAEQDAQRAEELARKKERERKQRERREHDLATLGTLVEELEAMAQTGKHRAAERLLQQADKRFEGLKLPEGSTEQVTRFHDARQALFIKVQELREADDWQRWANVPRREALIEKAKALLADPDDTKLGERLKALQTEWKSEGPVPHKKNQELWTLFKEVCDQIYERVKGLRAKLNEEHQHNLERKLALCERVEALAESTDWEETANEIKHLQREWKTIGPVPRKKSDAIWKRFRGACDRFFERRKPYMDELMAERTKNLEAKQALCEQAEGLAESTDWQETAATLRQLQRDWRNVGPVPRKDHNAVNKRFRGACDRFFERRKAHEEEERAARKRKLDELRAEIETLTRGPAEGETAAEGEQSLAARALSIRSQLREIDLPEATKQEFYEAANALYRKVLEADPEAFAGTELDPATSLQKKQKILARAEHIAPPPHDPTPTGETADEIVQRLRAALAENALSSSLANSTDGRSTADAITEMRRSWLHIGPVPGPEGKDLEARFAAACERALRMAGQDA